MFSCISCKSKKKKKKKSKLPPTTNNSAGNNTESAPAITSTGGVDDGDGTARMEISTTSGVTKSQVQQVVQARES